MVVVTGIMVGSPDVCAFMCMYVCVHVHVCAFMCTFMCMCVHACVGGGGDSL